MKKSILFLGGLTLLAPCVASAQLFSLQSATEEIIRIEHQLTAEALPLGTENTVTIDALDYVNYSTTHEIVSMEVGAPSLPFYTESVAIPFNGAAHLEVSHTGYTDFEDVLIAPSKGSLKRNVSPSAVAYTFGEAYETDAFFPGELATITTPFNLRNSRGVTVIVNPYQYNPVTKTLRVYHHISAKIVIDPTVEGINELVPQVETSATFMEIYDQFYLNPSALKTDARYTPQEEEGDLLIITTNSFVDEIMPLVVWKTQAGIKTTIATKEDIGASDVAIKNYISDFYDENPNLVHVLLVGDHAQIPAHTYGPSGWEELWSDSYYGQMTGDLYPELFVGRFSGSSYQIQTMVERTLEYEKNPAAGEWMTRAIGLASNEGAGYGDDSEADWQHARNNRAKLLNYGYSKVYEFYDGSQGGADANGNPSPTIINPAVEEGIGLFNYTGHGDETTCVTGNYSSTHINSAENNGKYPFVISVACNNGTFTAGTCISETWLSAQYGGSPTGAIAACGSTILMAWAEPMQTQDEMAEIISEAYEGNRKATLGGIFYNAQISMLEDYGGSTTANEVMQTWVMFGDPSTLFRNKETMTLEVNHWWNVENGISSITADCLTEDATAAIVQDGILLGTAKVSGGAATITFPPLTSDEPLLLTVTKQNYKPYQAVITVGDGPASVNTEETQLVAVYPNPATTAVTVKWTNQEVPSRVEITDLSGKVVYQNNALNNSTELIETADFSKGVYLLSVTFGATVQTSKLIIR